MNKELKKTAMFAGTALVLVLLAWVTKANPQPHKIFEPQGQEFFPDFKDPLKVAALEVVDHDPLTNTYKPFRVRSSTASGRSRPTRIIRPTARSG